jgi:hypothetical protein
MSHVPAFPTTADRPAAPGGRPERPAARPQGGRRGADARPRTGSGAAVEGRAA